MMIMRRWLLLLRAWLKRSSLEPMVTTVFKEDERYTYRVLLHWLSFGPRWWVAKTDKQTKEEVGLLGKVSEELALMVLNAWYACPHPDYWRHHDQTRTCKQCGCILPSEINAA